LVYTSIFARDIDRVKTNGALKEKLFHSSLNYEHGKTKQKYLGTGGSVKDTQNTGRKYEWESSFGRTRPRWYDAVSMYLKQIQCEGMDSVALASDKKERQGLLSPAINLRLP